MKTFKKHGINVTPKEAALLVARYDPQKAGKVTFPKVPVTCRMA